MSMSAKATVAELAARFPAFDIVGKKRRPLRIGVYYDVTAAAPDIDAAELKRALSWYTSGFSYVAALREGAVRIDLAGAAAGTVSKVEAEGARGRLRSMKRRHKAKAAAPAPRTAASKVLRPAKAAAPKMAAPVNGRPPAKQPSKAKSATIAPAQPTGSSPRVRASLAALREAARTRTSSHPHQHKEHERT